MACTLAFSVASPTDYASSKSTTSSDTEPAVSILKQINQMNDDGSYTFGFEASDGSFRIENMDANGYMTGKYGYIDANGKLQETGNLFSYRSLKTLDMCNSFECIEMR